MPFTYTNRRGQLYYLRSGPKKGGGLQYFFSRDPAGEGTDKIPDGFEVYESIHGQVFLRRKKPQLIRIEEADLLRNTLAGLSNAHRYQSELKHNMLIVHENGTDLSGLAKFGLPVTPTQAEEMSRKFASYMPVMRFVLQDPISRHFAPERYCFRGSVDDWFSIGEPGALPSLLRKFLKHLGKETIFELF